MLLRILKNSTTAGYLIIPLLAVVAWLPSLRHDTVQQMIFDIHPMPLYEAGHQPDTCRFTRLADHCLCNPDTDRILSAETQYLLRHHQG
jgi:hypothetical protein